eukprot:2148826-Prymnesium_polylepis.3
MENVSLGVSDGGGVPYGAADDAVGRRRCVVADLRSAVTAESRLDCWRCSRVTDVDFGGIWRMAGALLSGADALEQLFRCPLCGPRRMLSLVHVAHRSVNAVKKTGNARAQFLCILTFLQPC